MPRYCFELAYNGRDFSGWQKQPNAPSVQESIEEALSALHSHEVIDVVGCGRTDAGVHAQHYVLHVDLPEVEDCAQLTFKLNRMLPKSIVIHSIRACAADFHARFDATRRTYRYFIHCHKNPFLANSWYMPQEFNLDAMNTAAQHLLGTQDFTSLAKLHTDVKTHICTVYHAAWNTSEEQIYFEITADRFLRNMVRACVGTLLDVGTGRIEPSDIPTILAAKDRQAASMSVPAHGLFLWQIEYPEATL
jgi:tRNA pseudouridine38-40 synthase